MITTQFERYNVQQTTSSPGISHDRISDFDTPEYIFSGSQKYLEKTAPPAAALSFTSSIHATLLLDVFQLDNNGSVLRLVRV